MAPNHTSSDSALPSQLVLKRALFQDGIHYSVKMAEMSYNRLRNTLYALSQNGAGTSLDLATASVSATTDAWSIIDSVHRLKELLRDTPGLKQKSKELELFYRRTADVEELRNAIQHLDTQIRLYVDDKLTVWGALNWVVSSNQTSKSVLMYSLVPGTLFERETPFLNPAGRTIRAPIDLITLNANKSICLSQLIDDVEEVVLWLGQALHVSMKDPPQAMLAKAEYRW